MLAGWYVFGIIPFFVWGKLFSILVWLKTTCWESFFYFQLTVALAGKIFSKRMKCSVDLLDTNFSDKGLVKNSEYVIKLINCKFQLIKWYFLTDLKSHAKNYFCRYFLIYADILTIWHHVDFHFWKVLPVPPTTLQAIWASGTHIPKIHLEDVYSACSIFLWFPLCWNCLCQIVKLSLSLLVTATGLEPTTT